VGVRVDIRWNANSAYVITWWQGNRTHASFCNDAFYRREPEPLINAVIPKPYMVDEYGDLYTLYVFSPVFRGDIQDLRAIHAEDDDRYPVDIDSPGNWRDVLGLAHTAIDCAVIKRYQSYALDMICGKIVHARAQISHAA
jgi:hypothetical protein